VKTLAFFVTNLKQSATYTYNEFKYIDMQVTKNTGRVIGLLFLLSAIAGGWGTSIRGLSGARTNTTDFLNSVVENASQMKLAIGLDMLGSAIAVLIAIYLYPIIKKYSSRLAIAYAGIALITFVIITLSNLVHWSLLAVGNQYDAGPGTELQHYTTLALMHYEAYYWSHFLLLMCYAIGGTLLYYFLLKTALVPKWLVIWGILAQTVVFAGAALQIVDIPVSFYLFVQNGIFILIFIGLLLALGFKTEKYNAL